MNAVPASLVALSAIPVGAGTLRLLQLAGGPQVLPADQRFDGSAPWMTLACSPKAGTGDLLFAQRLVFASAMAGCLVLGVAAARRRDIPAHRAWMIRAYAIGLAAGTQAFTEGFGGAVLGTGELRGDLAKGAGWVINLAIAEWAIRRADLAAPRGPRAPTHVRAALRGP